MRGTSNLLRSTLKNPIIKNPVVALYEYYIAKAKTLRHEDTKTLRH